MCALLRVCAALPCPAPSIARSKAGAPPDPPPPHAGAVELRSALAARFSVDLPATVSFDHPTPAALAAFIYAQLPRGEAGEAAAQEAGAGLDSWGASSSAGAPTSKRGRRRGAAAPRGGKAGSGGSSGAGKRAHAASVLARLSEVVAGVLGASVPAEQPLMEVRGPGWGGCRHSAP